MSTSTPFPMTTHEARQFLLGAYDTVREHVRHLGGAARRTLDRVGAAAESYVGDKIKRRVQPPIVAALVAAGIAMVVALVAVFRK